MGEIPAGDDWSSNSGLRSGTRVDSTVDLSVQHPVRLRKTITCTVYKIQYTVHIPLIALSSSPSVLQNQSLGRGESTVGSAFPSGISLLERPQRAGETVEDARVVSPFSKRPYYCRLVGRRVPTVRTRHRRGREGEWDYGSGTRVVVVVVVVAND